jgi:hypothetical protein
VDSNDAVGHFDRVRGQSHSLLSVLEGWFSTEEDRPFGVLFVGLAQMTDLADDVRSRLLHAAGILTNAARLSISDPNAIQIQITIAMTALESVQRLLRSVRSP